MKSLFRKSTLVLLSLMLVAVLFSGVSNANHGYYVVSFQANNNQWVAAEPSGNVVANRNKVGPWEKFNLIHISNHYYALQAQSNGRYVAFEPGGKVVANRTRIGSWEVVGLYYNADGTYSLRANSNGKWVAAEGGGGRELVANRSAIGPWEKFRIYWQ